MEPAIEVQKLFFQHIKDNLPAHISLVEEISELLSVSNDSAYRRIRGEKALSFDEIRALCIHFKLSLDQLFYLGTDSIIFTGKRMKGEDLDMENWLLYVLKQMQYINSLPGPELISLNKDIPIFHHFNFAELAAFKFFFWMKTILQVPALNKKNYVADEYIETLHEISRKIIEQFNKIPAQEVWTVECIHCTIRQIEYYKESKVFVSARDIVDIYNALEKTIDHIETQVEQGCKFAIGDPPGGHKASYKMHVNEFILGDNAHVVTANNSPHAVYMNHSVLEIMSTKDKYFTWHTYDHIQNIMRRSTLISGAGERERRKFFSTMREKIDNRRRAIGNY